MLNADTRVKHITKPYYVNNRISSQQKSQYSLKPHNVDPYSSSPPNAFMEKLKLRMVRYDNADIVLGNFDNI
jgi:hypothetical protein